MKVLHAIDCMKIGGAQRRLCQLLKGLHQVENMQSYLVVFSDEIDFPVLESLNVEIIVIKSEKYISYQSFVEYRKVVRGIRPDIVHSWQLILSFYTSLLSIEFKFKHINAMINESSSRAFFDKERMLARIIIPFANVIVSNSKAGLTAYKVRRKRNVFIVYNGFDFERIKEQKQIAFSGLTLKTWKKDYTVIGMIARFDQAKDYRTVIEAICCLLDEGKKIKFVAVGDGTTLNQCKSMIPVQYKDCFVFTGKRTDIEAIVPLFDIGVLSTFTEGISNSLMEYMAFKKPVVATDCAGNREIVVEGQTGLLAKSRDKHDWKEKLLALIENKDIQLLYGMNGFQRLREYFHLDKMILHYQDLYSGLSGEVNTYQAHQRVNAKF